MSGARSSSRNAQRTTRGVKKRQQEDVDTEDEDKGAPKPKKIKTNEIPPERGFPPEDCTWWTYYKLSEV